MPSPLKDLPGISPYIRLAGHSVRDNWHIGERILRDYLIIYLEKGTGRIQFPTREVEMKAGHWYFVSPGVKHVFDGWAPPQMLLHFVYFDLVYREKYAPLPKAPEGFLNVNHPAVQPNLLKPLGIDLNGEVHPANHAEAYRDLDLIVTSFERQPAFFRLNMAARLMLLLENILLGELRREEGDPGEKMVRWMESHLISNLEGSHPLAGLAAMAGYSEKQLVRLFKKHRGVSPTQFARRLKINKAKDLLRHSNMTLTAVAQTVGFSSLAYFSRTFQQFEKVSPSDYMGAH